MNHMAYVWGGCDKVIRQHCHHRQREGRKARVGVMLRLNAPCQSALNHLFYCVDCGKMVGKRQCALSWQPSVPASYYLMPCQLSITALVWERLAKTEQCEGELQML